MLMVLLDYCLYMRCYIYRNDKAYSEYGSPIVDFYTRYAICSLRENDISHYCTHS